MLLTHWRYTDLCYYKELKIQLPKQEDSMKRILSILFLTISIFLFTCLNAPAHMLWIESSNPDPYTGETVYLKLGFGHDYPGNKLATPEQLARVYALNSQGKQMGLNKIFPGFYKFIPKKEGTYLIQAQMQPGFITMTPDGHKKGNKKEHKEAKSCFRYHMNAASVIQTQKSPKQELPKSNKGLRLLPLNDLSSLETGDKVSFRVVFQGESIKNLNVLGTYKGSEKAWVQEDRSNDKGIVEFEITRKDPWLFQAKYTTPYKNREVCDKHTYKATITLSP